MKIVFSDYAVAAGVATDLVNTAPLVRRSTGEVLADPAALTQFLAGHDLHLEALAEGHPPTENDLCQVRALRQEVRTILEAPLDEDVVEGATALAARAAVLTLHGDVDDGWQWGVTTSAHATVADELAVLIGLGLLGALRTLSHDRFRHCASPDCDGMFVDTSKAGRRRYCMPEICGNRINAARHRARHRPTRHSTT